MGIMITKEMKNQATLESNRRNNYINHHFEVNHLTKSERDIIGFLGEFAASSLFGVDWRNNIRENYETIDSGDISINGLIIDVKTETLPKKYLDKLLTNTISDNGLYGRRLIHSGQVNLLKKYDIVVFGAMDRDSLDKWYPIGYQSTEFILNNYEVTNKRPDGGFYPFSALPIKTSDLLNINNLL